MYAREKEAHPEPGVSGIVSLSLRGAKPLVGASLRVGGWGSELQAFFNPTMTERGRGGS